MVKTFNKFRGYNRSRILNKKERRKNAAFRIENNNFDNLNNEIVKATKLDNCEYVFINNFYAGAKAKNTAGVTSIEDIIYIMKANA